jgi:ParB-like chromosome segregation protein Spo0J
MTTYKFSEAADIFPMMTGERFDDLVEDIKAHGLLEPIELDSHGRILDGRNRYQACLEAGVEPVAEKVSLPKGMDAFQYVMSKNLTRRQLTPKQRAEVVAKLSAKGYSVRQIAKEMGIPKSTVQDDKASSEAGQPEVTIEPTKEVVQFKNVLHNIARDLAKVVREAGKLTDEGNAAKLLRRAEAIATTVEDLLAEVRPEPKAEAKSKGKTDTGADPKVVRAWAREHGWADLKDRGKLPEAAKAAYYKEVQHAA